MRKFEEGKFTAEMQRRRDGAGKDNKLTSSPTISSLCVSSVKSLKCNLKAGFPHLEVLRITV